MALRGWRCAGSRYNFSQSQRKGGEMVTEHRFEIEPGQSEERRQRSKWANCLIGCLIVLGIAMVIAIVLGIWVARSFRGWAADFGSQAINQQIDASDLPAQEKVEVKEQVDRVKRAFADGSIPMKKAGEIIQKLMESPLMPTLVVAAVDKQYFDKSGLSNDEKAEGRITLKRFARGAVDKKIDEKGVDAVMGHVADRGSNGGWELRQRVSDADLKAALAEAKAKADEAGVAAQPGEIDPSDELKKIIDQYMPPGE
jgi:hypothetical protein